MIPARVITTPSACRAVRNTVRNVQRTVRYASESAGPSSAGGGAGALTGGLVGGGVALGVTYAWYHFSGAKASLQTAKQAKGYVDSAVDSLKVKFNETTPGTNDALNTLREAANKYASFIPGGRDYVDRAFKDLDSIRTKHSGEVDQIVSEAYGELRNVSKKGISLETAGDTVNVLSKHLQRLLSLAGDAAEDILNNHPQLKEKVGGSADQLRKLGENYGPKAKQEVNDAWQQINDIVKSGVQLDNVERIRKLIQDKTEKVRKMGEEAFNQGFEPIKPMLEKNPQIKQLVEENMQTLKENNITETVSKVRSAISSGNTADLESYIKQAKEKTQKFSSDQLSNWLQMVPNGSNIVSQLLKLRDVANKKGPEAEELVKSTMDEIQNVLSNKAKKAEELVDDGKQEAST